MANTTMNTNDNLLINDDKSAHCVPFILDRIRAHAAHHHDKNPPPPFFVGVNGVQGAGKTTLVSTLHRILTSSPYNLTAAVLSIDDLYLTHDAQVALAKSHPSNPLIQHRGQPSTHDLALAASVFSALRSRRPTKIPVYDKSAHGGQGDRADESTWIAVNGPGQDPVEVVIFEGWCVGFRALSDSELEEKWKAAVSERQRNADAYQGQLGRHVLENLRFVNDRLREYDILTDALDAFVHIDAEDTKFVYEWRLQQEASLRASKGTGMTDEQVVEFVNGYYPAYELYTETLRRGIYGGDKGKQLRLVVGKDRRVKSVEVI